MDEELATYQRAVELAQAVIAEKDRTIRELAMALEPGFAILDRYEATRIPLERIGLSADAIRALYDIRAACASAMLQRVDAGAALLAELATLRAALDKIDHHEVGAYEVTWSTMPEPCEACVEMREIAKAALDAAKGATGIQRQSGKRRRATMWIETDIGNLARALLARLSYDYGDAEDIDSEVAELFRRGERLLPIQDADTVLSLTEPREETE